MQRIMHMLANIQHNKSPDKSAEHLHMYLAHVQCTYMLSSAALSAVLGITHHSRREQIARRTLRRPTMYSASASHSS